MTTQQQHEAQIEVVLDSANGPKVIVPDNYDAEDVEAALPVGWTVGDNWHNGVKLGDGRRAYPLVRLTTVKHDNKTLTLTADAQLSNRVFAGWWGDAKDGETYQAEFSAPAKDDQGNEYTVYWQFEAIKGQEPEDDSNYPWHDESAICRVVSA